MSDFIVEKLTKSVGDKTVFKDISFIIHELDRIGLIGVNGTGKTMFCLVVQAMTEIVLLFLQRMIIRLAISLKNLNLMITKLSSIQCCQKM